MRRHSMALFVVCACLLLARTAIADDGSKTHLVTVRWLEKSLGDPAVLVLDASSQQLYAAQHVPGAVSADLFSYGLQEMTVADTERLYQSWGISPGKKIVVYDQGGGVTATRVFFALYYHGFPLEDLLILDGGLAKWQEAGLPVTKDVATAPKGTFTISKVNEDVRVRLPEVLAASGDTAGSVLVDALGPNWHFGEVAVFGTAGHIPHGVLLPSADFYNPDKTFKSAEEVNRMLTYLGIRPDQQIYTFCGGGVAASVPFFALKFIADYPKVKLFKESEMGWVQDERGLPYWTYDAPYLMRLSPWLQFWGGQILRMYGGAQVSIVDVRPAAQFNEGHVPFALNVPADTFRSGIADPGRLAGILGPAGVRASDEAVVVSGAGLTKDSALAFVMLEKLGQKKVSVFMDSMDRWAQLGYAVKKDATVVGPKKSAQDLSILPATYPDAPCKDVMIADPSSTHGVYPKVFVASGKDVPAKAPDGKVVHVPYTDLLNPDGTPKAAKDIWSILAKAGVPRYAEIVCISDDPGEAAVNYFVLKLMGFPDLKVLAPTS